VPQLDGAAFADGLAADGDEDRRLQRDEAEAGKDDLVAGELHGRIYAPGFGRPSSCSLLSAETLVHFCLALRALDSGVRRNDACG
jgi:hypothetical protein